MNARFRRLGLVFCLGLLSASMVSAQFPPPAPVVSIESLSAAGADLGVHLNWEEGTGVLPGNASIEIADSNGDGVTSVSFVPQWGQQTVWIPGGLPLQPSENGQPPRRNLELLGGPYEEVLISNDFTIMGAAGPALLKDQKVPVRKKKWCMLHLISIECIEPEDSGSDETFVTVNGVNIWETPMESGQAEIIDQWFCLGPSPGMSIPQLVKIWDEDSPDADDLLGTLKVNAQTPTSGTMSRHFYKDDAHYILDFEIRCFRQRFYPC